MIRISVDRKEEGRNPFKNETDDIRLQSRELIYPNELNNAFNAISRPEIGQPVDPRKPIVSFTKSDSRVDGSSYIGIIFRDGISRRFFNPAFDFREAIERGNHPFPSVIVANNP